MNKGFSIIIAMLLVSLPVQVGSGELAQAQSVQDQKSEADRWLDLGTQQYNKSYYQESIQSYQSQQFQIQNRNKGYIISVKKLTRSCKHRSIIKHKFD